VTTFAMPRPHPVMEVLLALTASRDARVELTADTLSVRLGLTWHAEIPRSSIRSAHPDPTRTVSVGAHGWGGRWLVNTTGSHLVGVILDPPARGRCLGVPISVRELRVSLADPDAFLAELDLPAV
jgi:hypothetical protein